MMWISASREERAHESLDVGTAHGTIGYAGGALVAGGYRKGGH